MAEVNTEHEDVISEQDNQAYLEAISDKNNNPFKDMYNMQPGEIDLSAEDGKDLVDLSQKSEAGFTENTLGTPWSLDISGSVGKGLDLMQVGTPGTGKREGQSLGGAYYPDSDLKSRSSSTAMKSPYKSSLTPKPGIRSWSVGNSSTHESGQNGHRQLGLDILHAKGPRTPSGKSILRSTTGGATLVGIRDSSGLSEVLASRRGLLEPPVESPGMRQKLLRANGRGQDASNKANFYAQELMKSELAKRKWRDEALRHRHNFAFGDPRVSTPVRVKRRQVVKTPELVPKSKRIQRDLRPLTSSAIVERWATPTGVLALCFVLYILRWIYLNVATIQLGK